MLDQAGLGAIRVTVQVGRCGWLGGELGYVNLGRPSYGQLAALVVEQAAVIEELRGEGRGVEGEGHGSGVSACAEFSEFVAAAVLGWPCEAAGTEKLASFVGAQAWRAARS